MIEFAKPNFLIVGAAKAGTTSLCKYLLQHPEIYFPEQKELRFFIKEEINKINKKDPLLKGILENSVLSEIEYFKQFPAQYKLRGEASVQYLYYYETAIRNIKKYLGDIPIIIMLRNPIDRALSNWMYLSFENLTLREALDSENERIKKRYNSFWFYLNQSLYYSQVNAYLESFSRVKIIFFEDFKSNTKNTLNDVLNFLNLESTFCFKTKSIFNKTTDYYLPRSHYIRRLANKQLFRLINSYFSNSKRSDMVKIRDLFFVKKSSFLKPEDIEYIKKLTHDEVVKIESLLSVDLKTWKS